MPEQSSPRRLSLLSLKSAFKPYAKLRIAKRYATRVKDKACEIRDVMLSWVCHDLYMTWRNVRVVREDAMRLGKRC